MAWARLEDGLGDHPKIAAAGVEPAWLYVCGLLYASRLLTDGFIPLNQVPRLTAIRRPARAAQLLVEVGLWEEAEGGFRIHDWADYNAPAERIREQRKLSADRQAKWRSAHRDDSGAFADAPQQRPRNALLTPLLTRDVTPPHVHPTLATTEATVTTEQPLPKPVKTRPKTAAVPPPSEAWAELLDKYVGKRTPTNLNRIACVEHSADPPSLEAMAWALGRAQRKGKIARPIDYALSFVDRYAEENDAREQPHANRGHGRDASGYGGTGREVRPAGGLARVLEYDPNDPTGERFHARHG